MASGNNDLDLDDVCRGQIRAQIDLKNLRLRCALRGARLEVLRENIPVGVWQHLCDNMNVDEWFNDEGRAL